MIQFSEEEDPDYRHASIDLFIDLAAHRRGFATDAIAASQMVVVFRSASIPA